MKRHVLVTNDDGVSSPFFVLLCEELARRFRLTIAAPDWERSWTGKSQTVTRPVVAHPVVVGGVEGHSLSGRPADCVNIGIYHLCDERPDLVVSGINVGTNCGAAFAISSGTIGACLEANIAGIPAIALSQHLDTRSWRLWKDEQRIAPPLLDRVTRQLASWLNGVFDFASNYSTRGHPTTLSVNFPHTEPSSPHPVLCNLSKARYHSCFQRTEYGFSHKLQGFDLDSDPESDLSQLVKGAITVTELDYQGLGVTPVLGEMTDD